MPRIFRLCGMMALSLLLGLMVVGCSGTIGLGNNPYTMQDGKKTPCEPRTSGNNVNTCGDNYYEVYNGQIYHCNIANGCDEDNPVTPLALSQSTQCKPYWVYDNLVDNGIAWKVVVKQNYVNGTAAPEQANVTVTTSKTVTVSDSAKLTASTSLEAGVDVYVGVDISASMTASVKAEINHSVTETVVVAVGNNITITVPPHETGYSIYGVRVQVVTGHLHDTNKCEGSKSDAGTDISYVPIDAEWCTWISNTPDPCPVVSD